MHYAAPLREQRALAAGEAIVDLSHRGIVTVTGADRLNWLHAMTSQGLARLAPGEGVETMLLDPNGRIQHAIRMVDDGETSWLLVDEGSAEALAAYLNRMRFAMRVEVADVSADYAAVLAFAGDAAAALNGLGPVVAWRDPWASVAPGGVQYAHSAEHAGADWTATQFVFARTELDSVVALVSSGTVQAAGLLALDALEVRAWRPAQHGDVDERSIPHEFDWLRTAVHLTKGCYRGQETVAKVHNLGHPPRRLVLLHLDGSAGELPVPGALVYPDGKAADPDARPVGRITRAALHYEWGPIALALVKRSVAEDALLEVRGGAAGADPAAAVLETLAASQEVIVPADAGATRRVPRLKRL
ncbi:folate-binding protein [Leucobacter sp. gxy201]